MALTDHACRVSQKSVALVGGLGVKTQKEVLTIDSLGKDLRGWEIVLANWPGDLEERRRALRQDQNPEAVVVEYQKTLRYTKQVEKSLKQYTDDLQQILAILSKNKMQRYCELRKREIREGATGFISRGLSKLRLSFDKSEKQAQPKINELLSVMHEGEKVVVLGRDHLRWIETVAWGLGVSLFQEDRPEPQVVPDPEEKISRDTDEIEKSGKVATKIAKKHDYPDKDITAVCIAVACKRDGITDRLEVARNLKRGARNHYKSEKRSRLVERTWLLTSKGKTGFSSHVHRLRNKAHDPRYNALDGTTMADSIRKDYKLSLKYPLP